MQECQFNVAAVFGGWEMGTWDVFGFPIFLVVPYCDVVLLCKF